MEYFGNLFVCVHSQLPELLCQLYVLSKPINKLVSAVNYCLCMGGVALRFQVTSISFKTPCTP